jgi:muramoyltetrapeptide carboxypeptidase
MCVRARMRLPPPLSAGSRVALVAPSGPLRGEVDVRRAIDTTRSLGWAPVIGKHVSERQFYFAGSDDHRLADLNDAINDESIDGIWCIRGGYGSMRLLDGLDYDAWRRRPRTLIGYSDITALHLAIGGQTGLITFHGPTARAELTAFSSAMLRRAACDRESYCLHAPESETLRSGRARGRLVGGNLALVASLMGTPCAASLEGAILFLEDVNESVYRIDRMLTQLRLSGELGRVAALAFGQFTEIPADATSDDDARPLSDLLREVANQCGVPCVANIPVGHIGDQWTLPIGAMAELDADVKSLTIDLTS